VSLEESKEHEASVAKARDYKVELAAAHSLIALWKLYDRTAIDGTLTTEDKVLARNDIPAAWKTMVYRKPRPGDGPLHGTASD
jgi:hypothetical protein